MLHSFRLMSGIIFNPPIVVTSVKFIFMPCTYNYICVLNHSLNMVYIVYKSLNSEMFEAMMLMLTFGSLDRREDFPVEKRAKLDLLIRLVLWVLHQMNAYDNSFLLLI